MNLLRQPYPQNDTGNRAWRLALSFGLFVGAFLWLFQPFDINTWQTDHKLLKVWGFGGITFGVMAIVGVIVPQLMPRIFAEERWTVGKQIAYILAQIILIATANQLYLAWLVGRAYGGGWAWSLAITFLVGIFPTTGAVVVNYIRQLKRYQQQAASLSASLPAHHPDAAPDQAPPPDEPPTAQSGRPVTLSVDSIRLLAENEKDTFALPPDDLLAIESSDNYYTIFYARKDTVAKELMRSSLSRLESQLASNQYASSPTLTEAASMSSSPFVRCHRSYVVNLDRVERVSGNAQGYKLHLLGGQLTIPVARKYNDTLMAGLGQV